ncbi:MAG TPA: T9SS type A sorting domain-containing protein [Bacteroidia bacterium]|nr:T9SS type A sorting domain-containing protein [Bacteroidia bacterium]
MKKITSLLCFVLISSGIAAQSFSNQYGPGISTNLNPFAQLFKIISTSDGGYACITPSTNSAATQSSFSVVKTDFSGNVLWAFAYDSVTQHDFAYQIVQLPDSSLAIGGESNAGKIHYWHISASGALLSAYAYHDTTPLTIQTGRSLSLSGDGNLVFAGRNKDNHFVMKTTIAGNLLWAKSFGHNLPYHIAGADVVTGTSDGGMLVAGVMYRDTVSPQDTSDLEIIKLDAAGNLQWFRQLGPGAQTVSVSAVCETSTGDYLIGGRYGAFASWQSLLKISATGNVKWFKLIGSGIGNNGFISEKSNGNYLVGTVWTTPPGLTHVDTSGNVSAVGLYNYSSAYPFSSLAATLSQDSGVAFYGSDYSNLFIIKTNSLFQASCNMGSVAGSSSGIPFVIDTVINIFYPVITVQDVTSTFTVTPVAAPVINICLTTAEEEMNANHTSVLIFPNPSNGKCFVRTTEINSTLTFMNSLGQIIYREEITKPETEIDFQALREGIYFYILTTQTGIKASGKLAVE